jgi:transketolase
MHISTLKPFNDESVKEALTAVRYGVITMENHSIVGGLGTIIAEKMAELGSGRKLIRVGIHDQYAHGASVNYLKKEYGIDAMALVRAVEKLVGSSLDISETQLAAIYLAPVHSAAKAEAL